MPSGEPIVTPRDVLSALNLLRQRGSEALLTELETHEPDLIEHVLSIVTLMHGDLSKTALSPKQVRRVIKEYEALAIIVAYAMRQGYARLLTPAPAPAPGSGSAPPPPADPSLN